MNKKQKVALWVGLISFGGMGFYANIDHRAVFHDLAELLVHLFTTAVVTAAVIYLLKDPPKKSDDDNG